MGLDLLAVKYLLYDVGVPATSQVAADGGRTALHYLSLMPVMAEEHPRGHVFSLLQGRVTWLSKYFDPEEISPQSTVYSRLHVSKKSCHIVTTLL